MLKLPGNLTASEFLQRHWQKQALAMPAAVDRIRPAVTRNELGWLATQPDVESRLVFVDRSGPKPHYTAESGPFEPDYLAALPHRNWTLLVHDVEKHLPAMRALFKLVPFVPEWRIDDLMVSFAAPGGGVGPHLDQYDVFLCQGVGVRNWRFTSDDIAADHEASSDLALLQEFTKSDSFDAREGDVLYLPPGVAHWGTAQRACITYSLGMRAPQASDLEVNSGCKSKDSNAFYQDPDLSVDESHAAVISPRSVRRAAKLFSSTTHDTEAIARALGIFSTQPKDWLCPVLPDRDEAAGMMRRLQSGRVLRVHGMSLIARDDSSLYANGRPYALSESGKQIVDRIACKRKLQCSKAEYREHKNTLEFLLSCGVFEIPENL